MKKTVTRFDLENQIHSAWNICSDLTLFLENYDELAEDEKLNVLIGIGELAELRFKKLWSTFEDLVHTGVMDKNNV